MSLLTSASIWTNDDSNKKRTPALRKTIKKMPAYMPPSNLSQSEEYVSEDQTYQDSKYEDSNSSNNTIKHNSIEDTQSIHEMRGSRVNELLNKITAVNVENDGNNLANFNPPSNPEISQKKGTLGVIDESSQNPLNIPPPSIRKDLGPSNYSANNMNLAKLSNYQMSYETPSIVPHQPYYAKMGLGGHHNQSHDNKLMEKINYMIHLLEEQHNEKTSNIMEEFILYTFLGVFVIFIVDSFARAGKYTR